VGEVRLDVPKEPALKPKAWLIISMNALYSVAEALCSAFVSVYFYINSLDINLVFQHYITLYAVTPVAFIFAGWYAKTKDRTYVFRIGLILHAVYYATLLYLREDSVDFVIPLGGLLGVTWGFFWAGNNTFQFDYSEGGKGREYFLGLISAVSGGAKMAAPFISGAIIEFAVTPEWGYHTIFFTALVIYLVAIGLSFRIPHIRSHQPFAIWKALFPPKEHRDWRLIMLASASLAGSFHIYHFLLAILMFMQSGSEAAVGGFVSLQGLINITTSFLVGRYAKSHRRIRFLFWGLLFLLAAGMVVAWKITITTLLLFAFLNSISLPLFGIPHTGIRFEVMQNTIADPTERIEYLCAWEAPLAVGRILMMTVIMILYALAGEQGLRFALLLLCLNRIATYWLLKRVSFLKEPATPE
jgi:MFS transporter, YQGE family, putative transporter